MENCIFCKIIKGEIPSFKVWEDQNFLAFLSIEPINDGHTLVIPKIHVPYLFDMEDKNLGSLMIACKPIAKALKEAFNPLSGKVGVIVAGLDVSHVHIHLIPLDNAGDLNVERARHDVPFEEIQKNVEKIQASLRCPQ